MPPVNENQNHAHASSGVGQNASGGSSQKKFTFPSHQFHMVTLAKMCQENKEYTDCVIRCGEDELRAHRLVLGAASPFLKIVFAEIPSSLAEATILVPGVKQRVVKALLDFLYTGQMTVERQDTSDLQLLIDTLQIDPGLITVDAVTNKSDPGDGEEEEVIVDDAEAGTSVAPPKENPSLPAGTEIEQLPPLTTSTSVSSAGELSETPSSASQSDTLDNESSEIEIAVSAEEKNLETEAEVSTQVTGQKRKASDEETGQDSTENVVEDPDEKESSGESVAKKAKVDDIATKTEEDKKSEELPKTSDTKDE